MSQEYGSCIIQAVHFFPADPGNVSKSFKDVEFDCKFDRGFLLPLDLDANQEKEMRSMLEDGRLVANHSMLLFNPRDGDATASKLLEAQVIDESVRIPRGVDVLSYVRTPPTPSTPAYHKQDEDAAPKRVLLIKAIDSRGDTFHRTPAQLSDYVFGTGGDSVTARSQLNACSYDKVDLKPESPSDSDTNTSAEGVITVTISIPFNSSSRNQVQDAVTAKAEEILGYDLSVAYDHVLISVKCYNECKWAGMLFIIFNRLYFADLMLLIASILIHIITIYPTIKPTDMLIAG